MENKRYPGVRPFETADKDLFFGREHDVHRLSVLITLEKLVVLFGKSGYGKSSLINAGIIPHLKGIEEEDMHVAPIVVRLGSYSGEETKTTPIEKVLAGLYAYSLNKKSEPNVEINVSQESNPKMLDSAFLGNLVSEQSLWYHFKRRQTFGNARYLLIFDQFEEFFTYPVVQQEIFKTQLAELLYSDMPQSVRAATPNLDKAQRRFLSEPLDVKVLFSIRADRMSQLDKLKDKLPAILHKCFELKGLSESQAQEAIEKPAQKQGDYSTPPFTYSPEALRLMLKKLGENKQHLQNTGIEAFQLQILCEYLEEEVSKGRVSKNRVEPAHFEDKIEVIYEGYYQRLLDKLPKKTAKTAQRMIEESLIFNDVQTGESRRLSMDSDILVQRYTGKGVTHETLHVLENAFLLRREANNMGGFSYEVSHDTLVGPIFRMKNERVAWENQRRLVRIIGVMVLALAIVTGVVLYFYKLKGDAVIAQNEALRLRNVSLKKADSLNLALKEIGIQKDSIDKQQQLTEFALGQLEGASAQIASLLVKDSEKMIYELRYDLALEKLRAALPLKSRKPDIIKGLLELAFFYTEAGQYQQARGIVENVLLFRAVTRDKALPNKPTRSALNEIIESMDPIWYDSLKLKYYPQMIDVKGGAFCFGSIASVEKCDTNLFYLERVDNFRIARTETTVWQYFLYATATGRKLERPSWGWAGDNPVVNISWYEAIAYIVWLNKQLGKEQVYALNIPPDPNELDNSQRLNWKKVVKWDAKGYRLPTEIEWEYVARGGINENRYTYSGSDNIDPSSWFKFNSDNRTQKVGTKIKNSLGIADMSGNAYEWCWNWTDPLSPTDSRRMQAPKEGQYPVLRGGSWNFLAEESKILSKGSENPKAKSDFIGFRVMLSL